jgi:Ca2+-binding EF-hand superfamily protein
MDYIYGDDNKVYGKDMSESRYNALLETFYSSFPNLESKIKVGKNYFERDPNTAQLLEKRVLGQGVYVPDEDQNLLENLKLAYETTRLNIQTCTNQKGESACKSLKFKGMGRCSYEKKWFSYIRGGNCVIDEAIVKHLLNNLQSYVNITWNPLNVRVVSGQVNRPFPNPDELTKVDMVNLIHDLTYYSGLVVKNSNVITLIEKKHGKSLSDLSSQDLLYYVYLFSFLSYMSQFLSQSAFNDLISKVGNSKLEKLMNDYPSPVNFIEFLTFIARTLSKEEPGLIQKATNMFASAKNWAQGVISSSVLVATLLKGISVKDAVNSVNSFIGSLGDGNIDEEVERRLNEWKVQKYSENRFLQKIPEDRIRDQRDIIRRNLETRKN